MSPALPLTIDRERRRQTVDEPLCLCPSRSVSSPVLLARGLFTKMPLDDGRPPPLTPDLASSHRRPSLPFLYVLPSPTPPSSSLPTLTREGLPSPDVDLSSPAASPLNSPESSAGRSTGRSSGQGTTDHLKDFVLGSDESDALLRRGLVVDDRAQMDDLMGRATEAADCGAFLSSPPPSLLGPCKTARLTSVPHLPLGRV